MTPTNSLTRTFRYDAEQRLLGVEEDGTPLATYAYDAQGRRIEKAVGSGLGAQRTRYLYDGAQVLTETSATQALKARYVYGPGIDEPLLMVRQGRFSYLHQDGLGSVTAATDARGALVETYRYRAFGEGTVLAPDGSARAASALQNPYRFTGRELDGETNLYFYRARYYQQTIGRFLTPDPFPASPTNPQSLHRYSYVENNPINRLDPLGLRAEAAEIPDSRLERMRDSNRTGGGGGGGGGGDPPSGDRERKEVGGRAPFPPALADFLQRVGFETTADASFFLRHFPEGKEVALTEQRAGINIAPDTIITVRQLEDNRIRGAATRPIGMTVTVDVEVGIGPFKTTIPISAVNRATEATFTFDAAQNQVTAIQANFESKRFREGISQMKPISLPSEEELKKYEVLFR
ncbi:MAG: RHS repeat-associated core domain-containing protein [Candidatus Omnitrophica bacterium]|nr:RHS repeat-associated core domain-containing protein [Candidatus Omnitrophota bacterium]MBI3082910.1 RHS repeat-associated core domain-containing protein [Candidatus Omnitrophota bacterium]